jgi:hypothetical protein
MSNSHDTWIGNVPATTISLARFQVTPYEGRVAEFNIATWLHLPGLANVAVSLLISYQDGATRREVVIDHGKVNTHGKILLSSGSRAASHPTNDCGHWLKVRPVTRFSRSSAALGSRWCR